jgi:hypothetical protein
VKKHTTEQQITKNKGRRIFSTRRRGKEKEVEEKRMLLECDLVAAQSATEWAQKFILLLIFLAS